MRHMPIKSIVAASALALLGSGAFGMLSTANAAPWLAPASQEELQAGWVAKIEKEFRKDKYQRIFMNVEGGSPQSAMLSRLNQAAVALEEGNVDYARELVRQSTRMLGSAVEQGWMDRDSAQEIKQIVWSNAEPYLNKPGKQKDTRAPTKETGNNRWTGYTDDLKDMGITFRQNIERLPE